MSDHVREECGQARVVPENGITFVGFILPAHRCGEEAGHAALAAFAGHQQRLVVRAQHNGRALPHLHVMAEQRHHWSGEIQAHEGRVTPGSGMWRKHTPVPLQIESARRFNRKQFTEAGSVDTGLAKRDRPPEHEQPATGLDPLLHGDSLRQAEVVDVRPGHDQDIESVKFLRSARLPRAATTVVEGRGRDLDARDLGERQIEQEVVAEITPHQMRLPRASAGLRVWRFC